MNSDYGRIWHRIGLLTVILLLTCPLPGQAPTAQAAAHKDDTPESTATFRSFTRLVTIQVVAKDHHGHHVTGLTPKDFEIFEQDIKDNKKRPEKIANFQEVKFSELAKQSPPPMRVPAGVYTNAVTLTKNPVPPTILMVDGLNTEIKDQAQIQVQLDRIVKSIPKNTPVAIFLLGWHLRILQDFSTDPELLKIALKKASSTATAGLTTGDPMDNPNEASAQFENLRGHEVDVTGGTGATQGSAPGSAQSGSSAGAGQSAIDAQIQAMADFAQGMEVAEFKTNMDRRVQQTMDALITIGHYVAGYPGRKNLLWISSSFPIKLNGYVLDTGHVHTSAFSDINAATGEGYAAYGAQIRQAASILSDAKIAVYPVNPQGVQPHAIYGADAVPRNYSGAGMGATMSREIVMLADQDKTMRVLAEDTGGAVCNGTNDLGECLTKAFDDSSSYYEISYYPDSQDWNGDYRKIIVESKRSGLHLEYRHGYFAGQTPAQNQKAELQQAACEGYLSATSVVFAATKLPAQPAGELRFYMDIDPQSLTLSPTSDGGRKFSIEVAACTFDRKGKPLQLLTQPISGTLTPKQYEIVSRDGLAHVMAIPAPQPAAVRLVVKDVPTDHIGTVHVNLDNAVTTKAAAQLKSAIVAAKAR